MIGVVVVAVVAIPAGTEILPFVLPTVLLIFLNGSIIVRVSMTYIYGVVVAVVVVVILSFSFCS